MYLIIGKSYDEERGRRYEKKISITKRITYCIGFCVLLYFLGSVVIGLRIEGLIIAANAYSTRENPSPEILSDESFHGLGYKSDYLKWYDSLDVWEFSIRTPVATLYGSRSAKSVFLYWAESGRVDGGSGGIATIWITSEWKDGKWVITDVFEAV